ncbi:MAG: hypothetical protein ABSG93_02900 [Solirubrobacteraceae bacterium]|jgi:hypothetical protein
MTRLAHAWRALAPEQRLAALTALGLFASMFLPWYSKTDTLVVRDTAKATETSLSAFQAFSFVEAAVLLVSAGVLAMLFARAERRNFQLPGGDGVIVMIAGGWAALLIFYRLLDKPGLQGNERVTATVGVEWGIFIALLLALGLLYAGGRMRALERPAPPVRRARGRRAHETTDPETIWDPSPPRDPQPRRRSRPRPDPAARPVEPPAPREPGPSSDLDTTVVAPGRIRAGGPARPVTPVPAREHAGRARYPPAPPGSAREGEQLSFEDPPTGSD